MIIPVFPGRITPLTAKKIQFAFITIAQTQPERAARRLGAADALRELASGPMLDYERVAY